MITESANKRGKMLFISFLFTAIMFVAKILGSEFSNWQIILFSVLGFIATYIGMMWVLGWEVSKRALLLFIPQSALFISAEILFWFLFFSIGFDRLSETLLLLVILMVFFFCNYGAFLMANIFTISSFKQIPLEQVAKTTSYVLSIFTVYLVTFSLYALALPLYVLIPILGIFFFIILFLHSIHLQLPDQFFKRFIMVGWWAMLIITLSFSFIAQKHELLALVPAVVMYIAVDIVVIVMTKRFTVLSALSYLGLAIFIVLVNFFL